ncbi:MAG: Rrf2 family transcriptional regulator [Myxococcales bacterium]|nr:Rrf2 family transcriptional regulator [Myxococcales bacterium]
MFSQTVEYALRSMIYLALHSGDSRFVRVADLAEAAHIPPAYLAKVMRRMAAAGLVRGQKGHNGGFALAHEPSKITLRSVLEAAGVSFEPLHCAFGLPKCNPKKPCVLHDTWSDFKERCEHWASSYTLADVLATPSGKDTLVALRTPSTTAPAATADG